MSTESKVEVLELLDCLEKPTHPKINLSTCEDVRREMARLYRDARTGRLPIGDATRLSYIMVQIIKAHEIMVLEKRIDALEAIS